MGAFNWALNERKGKLKKTGSVKLGYVYVCLHAVGMFCMAAKYRETYNEEPSKHRQFVDGNDIAVNFIYRL